MVSCEKVFATSNLIFFYSSFLSNFTTTFANKGVSKMRNFTGKLRLNDASFFFPVLSHVPHIQYNIVLGIFLLFLKQFQIRAKKRNSNSSPVVLSTSNVGAVFFRRVSVLKLLHVASYVIVSHSLPHLFPSYPSYYAALNFCLNVLFSKKNERRRKGT